MGAISDMVLMGDRKRFSAWILAIAVAILFVAGSENSVLYGATLRGAYAAGLGVPFLIAALAAGPFTRFMLRFRQHIRKVEIVLGVLLVATGECYA